MLYVFWGPNDFSMRQELIRMRAALGQADLAGLNHAEADASALGPGELAALAQTMPFLGERRLAIIRGLLAPFEPRQKMGTAESAEAGGDDSASTKKREANLGPILEVLANLPPTNDLVLQERTVSKKNPLFARLPKDTIVREFPLPGGPDLDRWIVDRAKEMGGAIIPAAAHIISENVGADLWTIDSELQKLVLYASGRPIAEADVQLMVSQVREASIFSLVDAVMASRPGVAIGLAHQLLDGGSSPSRLLTLLARQVRLLLQAKEMCAEGKSTESMAAALGFRSPWAAKKLAQQAQAYTYQELGAIYRRLVDEDLALKTSRHTPEVGIDVLVVELCGRA